MSEITSPIKAIKAYCIGCCGGITNEVKSCAISDCELFPFRFGKNPFHHPKREYTEEQRAAIGERLKTARQNK